MKHKHYEMIVAKAANMDLVLFVKRPDTEWVVCDKRVFPYISEYEYFLCLPQHNENGQCLHWLNGCQLNIDNGKGLGIGRYTLSIENNFPLCDFISHPEYTFIIEPKKEKRWIIWNENQDSYHCTFLVDPSDKYEANFKFSIHEIEVEV